MDKKVEVKEGVVAKYNGLYWGVQYSDSRSETKDFGPIENAIISDPKYCTKPTDMTWDPKNTGGYNSEYNKLEKAELVKIKKTIVIVFEIE